MRFTKMHGLGNCYVFVDCFDEVTLMSPVLRDPSMLARAVSDRNTGVGSDGLILIRPSEQADARMEMYNLDGSRAQMCGNGIRCLAKYVHDHGRSRNNPLTVETDAGVLSLELVVENDRVEQVKVDMGRPGLEPEDMPTRLNREQMIDYGIDVMGDPATMTCVSMGNPHAVVYGVKLDHFTPELLRDEGTRIELNPLFPERVNVHFVEVNRPDDVTMLPWERGSGATLACGTGACAVCVAGVLTSRSGRSVNVHLPGGDLHIEWSESDEHVYMTGPAVEIFQGDWPG